VLNFSEALAKELEDFNVVVTCLSPGATDTNFFNVAGLGNAKGIWAKSALMKPREVAEIGVNAMFAKKLSLIAGILNSFFAFTNRLAPRTICAITSKKIIKQATS
jgi:short-subunit dehydrogenase